MLKAAFALPTLLRARNNPDGKTLREVLPADLYGRWQALKPRYLGNDGGVEKMRPIMAASILYDAAIKQAGLQPGAGVGKRLTQLVKQHGITRTSTKLEREVTDPRGLAKLIASSEMDDIACFRQVLDRLEADVANAAERANAWAAGDLAALMRLQRGGVKSCFDVVAASEVGAALEMDAAMDVNRAQWFAAVDTALQTHPVSFATLPVENLLNAEGVLATLAATGYQVTPPAPASGDE